MAPCCRGVRGALAAYQRVREIGLHDDESTAGHSGGAAYLIPRCHAALGEDDRAVEMLEVTMGEGFVGIEGNAA